MRILIDCVTFEFVLNFIRIGNASTPGNGDQYCSAFMPNDSVYGTVLFNILNSHTVFCEFVMSTVLSFFNLKRVSLSQTMGSTI